MCLFMISSAIKHYSYLKVLISANVRPTWNITKTDFKICIFTVFVAIFQICRHIFVLNDIFRHIGLWHFDKVYIFILKLSQNCVLKNSNFSGGCPYRKKICSPFFLHRWFKIRLFLLFSVWQWLKFRVVDPNWTCLPV